MLGIKTHCYASMPQEDLAKQQVITGNDALKLVKMWEITPTHNAQIRDDYHPDTRDAVEDIPLDQGPHEVTGESYLLGAGIQGAPPDLSRVYATAFEEAIALGTSPISQETATTIRVSDGTDAWEKGDLLKVDPGTGARYVLALNKEGGEGEPKTYTVWPPFDQAVSTDARIKPNVNYRLANDNEKSVTIYTVDDSTAIAGIGTTLSKFTFTFARGQSAKVEMSGQCRDIKRVMQTELFNGADLLPGDTTLTLASPTCEPGAVIHVIDDSDPENRIEEYILLGYSADRLTFHGCTRGFGGSTPQTLIDGLPCSGYRLEDITAGSPIRGLNGSICLGPADDEKRLIRMPADMETRVTIDEKHKLLGTFGDGGKAAFKLCPENREVTVSISGYCEAEMAASLLDAVRDKPMRVLIQCGGSDGRSFAVALPKVVFHPPLIGDAKGDVTKVILESRAVLFDSDNQIGSVVFAY